MHKYIPSSTEFDLGKTQIPFQLAVSQGQIPGYSNVDKYGENPLILSGEGADITEVGGDYVYDTDGTAPIQYISSDNALDVGVIVTISGNSIDESLVTQSVTTDGQNVVALDTPLWRVWRMENDSPTGGELTGKLYCHTDPTPTAGVPDAGTARALIDDGNGQTLMAVYTIPKGYVGYLALGEVGCGIAGAAGTTSEFARISYISRRYGKVPKVKKRVKCSINGNSNYANPRTFWDIIPALTDVRLRTEYVSENMSVWGAFDILLVEEGMFPESYLTAIGQPGYTT